MKQQQTHSTMKKARLSVEEENGLFDFAHIQFDNDEDPVERYLNTRRAENKSPMFKKPMPKNVKLDEVY